MSAGKRILVIGAGAIGGYVGGSLALAGHETYFLCRPETAGALREHGLRLVLPAGAQHVRPRVVETVNAAFQGSGVDLILLAVKRYHTQEAVAALAPYLSALPPILSLQNGVGGEDDVRGILGGGVIIPGTVTTAVGRPSRTEIVVERFRGLGLAGRHAGVAYWGPAFNRAGLNAIHYPDAGSMIWSKLLINLIANPTSAILDMTPAEIFAHRGLFRLEMHQLREALRVMKGLGAKVVDLPGTPVRLLAFSARYLPLRLAQLVLGPAIARGRGAKMPSFHGDLHSGKGQSEITYLHGAVVRAGEQLGVPTPANKLLVNVLTGMIAGEIDPGVYRRRPEKLLAGLP